MISAKTKFPALLLVFCAVFAVTAGCKSFSRLVNSGGTVYTVEIETEEPNKNEIIERAVRITQNKIDAIGLDGEVTKIPDKENQISVKIYATEDPERIKKFLFTTYRLELKKVAGNTFKTYPSKEAAEKTAAADQEVLPYSERDPSAPGPSQFIIVEKKAVINGEDIRDAQAYSATGGDDDYQINFSLKKDAAARFGEWTGKNIGNYLAIVLDKKVISAPVIQGQIFDTGQITGRFIKQEAEAMALSLTSGYLPATMRLIEEKTF